MPELFIVAGPNGAGKSSFSAAFVPFDVPVFDADRLIAERQKQYPEIGSWLHLDYIEKNIFPEMKEQAIKAGKDFAYETNFAGKDAHRTPREFKEAGYRINLVYLGLDRVEQAIKRVDLRVQAGGHFVPKAEIAERYEFGLRNIQQHLESFDRALFFRSGKSLAAMRQVLELEKGKIVFKSEKLPKWAMILSAGLEMKEREAKKSRGRGRGR